MTQLEKKCMEKDLRIFFKEKLPKHLDVIIKVKNVTFNGCEITNVDTREAIYCLN